jgi:flagella basal body P-ring formation protein FlgA
MSNLCFRSRSVQIIAAVLCLAAALPAHAGQVLLPVPRVTIYPGQVIDQGMLVERAFRAESADQVAAMPSSASLIGKVARQTLLPGRPVTQAALREPHAITQGQTTLVIFQSGALTITGNAVALQSGATGDVVSVRNVDSGRIIKGKIGADGAVHVGIP